MRRFLSLLSIIVIISVNAQSFEQPSANPFGLNLDNLVLEYHFASFTDLDGDGDQDMLVSDFDGFYTYLENTGSAIAPNFTTGVQNPFGLSRVDYDDCSCNTMVHRFVDIDNDGDMDIISIAWYGGEYWYAENIGTSSSPSYSDFSNEVEWMPASFTYGAYPGIDLVDIDNDGDLDLFSCQDDKLNLIRNTGTVDSPNFTGGHEADPFDVELSGKNLFPSLVDIDNDGDFDLFVGGNSFLKKDFQFYENIGTSEQAVFDTVQENPFDLENSEIDFPSLAFVDINGDSDMDIFLGGKLDDNMAFDFYDNKTFSTGVEELTSNNLQVYPNPTNGNILVENKSEDPIINIKVIDLLGAIYYSREAEFEKVISLDISDFESGLYLIQIETKGGQQLHRIVKQ
jgi:hypothetical protein